AHEDVPMASRKDKPTPPEKGQQPSRFTLDDIERAILGVKRAGLVVRSVEITATGSIKIEAGRPTEDIRYEVLTRRGTNKAIPISNAMSQRRVRGHDFHFVC